MVEWPLQDAPDDPRDYTNPEHEKQAIQASKDRDEMRRQFEAAIMASPQGRDWVFQLLYDCHVWEPRIPMTPSAYDQGRMNGERDVGLGLLQRFVKVSPQNFALMFTERDVKR